MANRYVENIRAGEGREGWPGGKAWSIDAWKRGMLRKKPKSVANGRKPFNLIGGQYDSGNSLRLIEKNVQIFCNLSRWIWNCGVGGGSNDVRLVKSHSRSGWRLWRMKFPRDWCLWILKLLNTRFQSTDIVLQNLNFGSFLTGCVFTVFSSRSTIALTADGLLAITSL